MLATHMSLIDWMAAALALVPLLALSRGISGAATSHGDLALTVQGKPASTIVTAKDPVLVVKLAVAELNHYVERISGTTLPVVDEDQPVTGNRILVGESKWTTKLGLCNTSFSRQEFLVETRPGLLILIGLDGDKRGKLNYETDGVWEGFTSDDFTYPMGTLYAVYDFLERYCGIRWYLPTELGEVVPKCPTLSFSEIHLRRKPWTRHRSMDVWAHVVAQLYWWDFSLDKEKDVRELSSRERNLYWLRLKMGGDPLAANHSLYSYVDRFSKSHPEYFAINEKGECDFGQLNYASDVVVDQVVNDIVACLHGQPDDENGLKRFNLPAAGKVFPVVPMDSGLSSYDEESQALLLPEPTRKIPSFDGFCNNQASRYWFGFVNKIAAKIRKIDPEVIISTLAYFDYFYPPDDMVLEPNVAITLCKPHVTTDRSRRYDDLYYQALRQWRSRVRYLYVWEYYNFPQWMGMNVFPGTVPRRIGEDLKKLRALPIEGEFIELNSARRMPYIRNWLVNPAMDHLNYYFTFKLLDDDGRSMHELLEEYWQLFYGPAAEPMREFFTLIEDTYLDERHYVPDHLDQDLSWTVLCPRDKLAEFATLISQAKLAAGGRQPYRSRVDLIDKAVYQFMQASSDQYWQKTKQ